jgi:hypothetical protein
MDGASQIEESVERKTDPVPLAANSATFALHPLVQIPSRLWRKQLAMLET